MYRVRCVYVYVCVVVVDHSLPSAHDVKWEKRICLTTIFMEQ